jgi:hypothetical protein
MRLQGVHMLTRILVRGLLLLGVITAAVFVTPAIQANPAVKWAAVYLPEPTLVAGTFIQGPVLFEHDDNRMTRGEPCTIVYQFRSGKGLGEELAAFHCRPRWGETSEKFGISTTRDVNGHCVLRSYQFAGDVESHGVPATLE